MSASFYLLSLEDWPLGWQLVPAGVGFKNKTSGGRSPRRASLWDPQEMRAVVREGCSWCSVVELGARL